MTHGRTALVTGANHGIGAATAVALARRGCAILCTYLRLQDEVGPGTPQGSMGLLGRPLQQSFRASRRQAKRQDSAGIRNPS